MKLNFRMNQNHKEKARYKQVMSPLLTSTQKQKAILKPITKVKLNLKIKTKLPKKMRWILLKIKRTITRMVKSKKIVKSNRIKIVTKTKKLLSLENLMIKINIAKKVKKIKMKQIKKIPKINKMESKAIMKNKMANRVNRLKIKQPQKMVLMMMTQMKANKTKRIKTKQLIKYSACTI